MEEVYIVLTFTGTILSKIVRIYTRKKYAHCSISLDKNLDNMYSFGRCNAYNPFIGGFVKEGVNFGTFKRFYNTTAVIYSLKVTPRQYLILKKKLDYFILNKQKYSFNTLGLIGVLFHIRLRRHYKFYCAEFVKYLLDSAEVKNSLPDIITPEDFKGLNNLSFIYEGKLREYISKGY